MTKDEALDKKADNAMIYKTFEQWMNGDFLEVGEPRKKAYSKDELLLVEMGWNYGYDAGRAVEQALDKKAENARELGLDYEPAQQEPYCYTYTENGEEYFAPPTAYVPDDAKPLYTSPPAQRTWVGLTYEEIDYQTKKDDHAVYFALGALWAEAKLKEKNT